MRGGRPRPAAAGAAGGAGAHGAARLWHGQSGVSRLEKLQPTLLQKYKVAIFCLHGQVLLEKAVFRLQESQGYDLNGLDCSCWLGCFFRKS